MLAHDETFLRRAIQLAHEARAAGADPFGALLAKDGVIVAEARDRCVATSDPTFHAELDLISTYCRANHLFSLEGYTLYASTEPCPMCAGAIHWARLARVVFSVAQAMLNTRSGGSLKPACGPIINMGGTPRIQVDGPLLPEEGLAVFDGYVWTPKHVRHRALFPPPDTQP